MSAAVGGKGVGPQAAPKVHPAVAPLEQLEALLADEREALVKLDREAIEAFARQKLELDERLRVIVEAQPLSDREQPLLERVRERALQNRLLLAHARSCVQGVLSLLSPNKSPGYSVGPSSKPPPVALDFRR